MQTLMAVDPCFKTLKYPKHSQNTVEAKAEHSGILHNETRARQDCIFEDPRD